MRAIWMNKVLAESKNTVVVEGNHYFPVSSLKSEYFKESDHHTGCPWKGTASYMDVVIGDAVNRNAAWFYPSPHAAAAEIKGMVAFWHGVEVVA